MWTLTNMNVNLLNSFMNSFGDKRQLRVYIVNE
jgi:hypothetical protein